MPLKWNVLLRSHEIKLPWMQAIQIYYVSTFFGLFLPATVGADALRAIYLKKHDIAMEDALASIVVERVLGALTILSFGLLCGLMFLAYFSNDPSNFTNFLMFALGFLIALILIFFVSLTTWFHTCFASFENKMKDKRYIGKITTALLKVYTAYALYRDQKGAMCIFFALTIIATAMPVAWSWLVALALGVDSVELAYFCAFVPLILLMVRVPITLHGIGINEGAFVYFLGLASVAASEAFSVGFTMHIIYLTTLLPGLVIYILKGSKYHFKADN